MILNVEFEGCCRGKLFQVQRVTQFKNRVLDFAGGVEVAKTMKDRWNANHKYIGSDWAYIYLVAFNEATHGLSPKERQQSKFHCRFEDNKNMLG